LSKGSSKTILLSPIGGQAMPGIIEYFNEKDFRVIGIDSNGDNANRFMVRTFIVVPAINEPNYRTEVLSIIKYFAVDLFVSWLDAEIRYWNSAAFCAWQTVNIPEELRRIFVFNFRKDLMEFYDKWLFYDKLRNEGFLIPETRLLRGGGTWERLKKFPVIFKPRIGTGSRDIHIVHNSDEYDYWSRVINLAEANASKFLAQKYIRGNEYTVDFFADRGKLINHVIRLRTKANGVSLAGSVVKDGDITDIVKRFCQHFNIDGLNNIQLIEDIEEHYFITDFNPRPSGTIMLSVRAGVDFFNNLIEKHEDKELTRYPQAKPLKMIRYLKEFYYA
jgi:carbamoyl-phosphate synthase large subunit